MAEAPGGLSRVGQRRYPRPPQVVAGPPAAERGRDRRHPQQLVELRDSVTEASQRARLGRLLMALLPCPYLSDDVELTDERERHIRDRHPDLLPTYRAQLAEVLADPDEVRRSPRFMSARSFVRWFDQVRGGKYVVVVVVSDSGTNRRHWV